MKKESKGRKQGKKRDFEEFCEFVNPIIEKDDWMNIRPLESREQLAFYDQLEGKRCKKAKRPVSAPKTEMILNHLFDILENKQNEMLQCLNRKLGMASNIAKYCGEKAGGRTWMEGLLTRRSKNDCRFDPGDSGE